MENYWIEHLHGVKMIVHQWQQIELAVCLYQIKINRIYREREEEKEENFVISHVRFNHECYANFIRNRKKEKYEEKSVCVGEREREKIGLDELSLLLLLTSSFLPSCF